MADSYSLSVLHNAGYTPISDKTYNQWRELVSDWVQVRNHIVHCSRCPNVGDEDYGDMIEVDGNWVCFDCIRAMAEERLDDDAGLAYLFDQIGKVR